MEARIRERLAAGKAAILGAMEEFLNRPETRRSLDLPWEHDLPGRLLEYSSRGKMVRGNLVLLGYELAGGKGAAALPAAAAFEIFQSGILMHDDIIDGDQVRRGRPAAHKAFEADLRRAGARQPGRTGESLAICLGDIALMLTFALLNETREPARNVSAVTAYWGREFARVGAAEMEDTYLAVSDDFPSEERILDLYRGKTAGYTFIVPLLSGALLADAPEELRGALADYAAALGVLFQIKDDELGLFGQAEALGKPVGSDIREGKKTIFWQKLMAASGPAERERLESIFGCPDLTDGMIAEVREALGAKGVLQEVETLSAGLAREAEAALGRLPEGPARQVLGGLIEASLRRRA